jgi:hypothetical protein
LKGYDETKFRSSRFTVWFNTPEEYFKEQLDIYRSIKPTEDAMQVHQYYQDKYGPASSIDAQGSLPIKVYSDYIQVINNLTDKSRYELVENPSDALIFWSSMDYYEVVRAQVKDIVDENKFYLN